MSTKDELTVVVNAEIKPWEFIDNVDDPPPFSRFGIKAGLKAYRRPDTGQVEEFSFFEKKPGVTVCPITREGNLVLVEQWKQAIGRPILEFPAGVYKGDARDCVEDILKELFQVANNELAQETGYVAEEMILTCPIMIRLAPRKSPSGFFTMLAAGCERKGQQQLDEGEVAIRVYEATPAQFVQLVREGEIVSTETLEAAAWAERTGLLNLPWHALSPVPFM